MQDAAQHLVTASAALAGGDLAGSFQLAYDAARKSLTGLALSRGLRSKGEGAHSTLITVVQFECAEDSGVGVVGTLDRLRRTRNRAEYSGHWFDRDEVEDAIGVAKAIVEWATPLGAPK
jgi:HEPN domain